MATNKWLGGDVGNENDWTVAVNFSLVAVPVVNDDVIVPAESAYSIDGVDASATAISSFTVEEGYTGTIGSSTTELKLDIGGTGTSDVDFAGTGESHLYIENANDIVINNAASAPSTGLYGLSLTGLDNDNLVIQASTNASIGLAPGAGEVFETDTLKIENANVYIGSGVVKKDGSTAIPLTVAGGTVTNKAALGEVDVRGGTFTHSAGVIATGNFLGGTSYYNSTGTLTTGHGAGNAILSFERSLQAKTVTNFTIHDENFRPYDKHGVVTWTNDVQGNNIDLGKVKARWGLNRKFKPVDI